MKVKFLTLGCKVNQYETQALIEEFRREGIEVTEDEADLYIVNTCTVTKRADTKSIESILKVKKQNPKTRVAAIGCLAQLNQEKLKALGVDYVVTQDKKPYLLETILNKPSLLEKNIWSLKIENFFNHRAFIKIQDGCDQYCSFCKIPYLRGKPRTRPKEDILKEIEKLSLNHKEIVLCGINIALYGKDVGYRENLTSLTKEILEIKSLGRLRLSSIQPMFINNEFLELFRNRKLCPHLHLPFQSGDDKILRLMNKKETSLLYIDVVRKARKLRPEIAISCDIMVGFPYEDEDSFNNTVKFLEEIKPMRVHIFRFSPREKTVFECTKLKNERGIKMRYNVLKTLVQKLSYQYKKSFLGESLFWVAEEKKGGYIRGYTENYIDVYVKDFVSLGDLVKVRIERVTQNRVYARVIP